MPLTRLTTIAEREAALLAPYAFASSHSRGRRHPESEHPYRGPFQRDRDRLIHSSAFRRLSGKMQVFTGEMGDYHRTRLTHTYEVASIARTIARALRLNEDLVEALALFHDIGHPPFGHAGEEALDACLQDAGGFSHNQYALTIAEELEVRSHRFVGLNLSWEVLEGQAARTRQPPGAFPLLEVQVVDLADSITYDAHDTDDAVKLGLLTLDRLSETVLIREILESLRQDRRQWSPPLLRKAVVHALIDCQVSDLLDEAASTLAATSPSSPEEVRDRSMRLMPSPAMQGQKAELESTLYQHVYRHPDLVRVRKVAQQQLTALFHALCERLDFLPERFQRRADRVGPDRSVADYLAGMTDRYCHQQFHRFCGTAQKDRDPEEPFDEDG